MAERNPVSWRMAGPVVDEDDCREAADVARCRCREAVVRAYSEMLTSGACPQVALDVATRVYRYHHPGAGVQLAGDVVETWVYTGPLN